MWVSKVKRDKRDRIRGDWIIGHGNGEKRGENEERRERREWGEGLGNMTLSYQYREGL